MKEVRNCIMVPGRRTKNHRAGIFLEIHDICKNFQVLPGPGGLLDQDSLFVYLMKHAMLCQKDRDELDRRKSGAAQLT
jgi:hypothetical protein